MGGQRPFVYFLIQPMSDIRVDDEVNPPLKKAKGQAPPKEV